MQTSVVTAKIKLLPSDEQMVALAQVRTLYTKACNWLSAKVYETKELGQLALHNAYYQQMRTKLGIKAQMTQSVIKTVIARYKSAKSNNHPWSLIEFRAEECDLVYNRDYSRTTARKESLASAQLQVELILSIPQVKMSSWITYKTRAIQQVMSWVQPNFGLTVKVSGLSWCQ